MAPAVDPTPLVPTTNWAGNVVFEAAEVVSPGGLGELRQLLGRASSAGVRVRALGSGHSFNRLADTDGVLVPMAQLDGIKGFGPGTGGHEVAIEGGVRYGELATYLHGCGRSLANLASLPHLSVAGAVMTGTHGSGDRNNNLAGAVRSIDLLLAGGDLVTLDRGHPDFDGAVVSLGALGFAVGVTLHTEPTFEMTQSVCLDLPLSVGVEHFDEIMSSAYSVSWFTRWQSPVIEQIWQKSVVTGPLGSVGLQRSVDLVALGARVATTPCHPVPDADPIACTEQLGVPGPWHARLPHFRLDHRPSVGHELQSEFFVPRTMAGQAIGAVAALGPALADALLVSEVRTVAADRLWLSPAFGRDVIALHFTWRPAWNLVRPALAAVEAALAPFDPVPHWGKVTGIDPHVVRGRYPKFADFAALVDRYDPGARFSNGWLDGLLRG